MKNWKSILGLAFLAICLSIAPIVFAQPVTPTNAAGNVPVSGTVGTFSSRVCTPTINAGTCGGNVTGSTISGSDYQFVVGGNNVCRLESDTTSLNCTSAIVSEVANAANGIIFSNEGVIAWPESSIAESGTFLLVSPPASGFWINGNLILHGSGACQIVGGVLSCGAQSQHAGVTNSIDDDTASAAGTFIGGTEPDAVSTNSAVRLGDQSAAPAADTIIAEVCYNCSRTSQGTQVWRVDHEGDVTSLGDVTKGFGTGTAVATVVGILSTQTTGVGNVGASGPDDLMTYTLPANTLVATNRCVRVTYYGTLANNANAKTIGVVWGSQTLMTKAMSISLANDTFNGSFTCCRTGTSTQDCYVETYNNGGTTLSLTDGATVYKEEAFVAGTQTETATIVIKLQSTASTSNNDIVQEGMIVEAL